MIVSPSTPRAVVEWFHIQQRSHIALCVLLAPSQEDIAKQTSLVNSVLEADSVLGDEIAMLFCSSYGSPDGTADFGVATSKESASGIPKHSEGKRIVYPLRELWSGAGDQARIAQQLSHGTAAFVPEFISLFRVGSSELPALCVVIRGIDECLVVPLGKAWTPTEMMAIFGQLRHAIDSLPDFLAEYRSLANEVPFKLPIVKDALGEITAKKREVGTLIDALFERYGANDQDRDLGADFLASKQLKPEDLEHLISSVSFSSQERFLKDGQLAKLRKYVLRFAEVRASLSLELEARAFVVSIEDRAKAIVKRREKLYEELQQIRNARIFIRTNHSARPISRIRNVLDGISTVQEYELKIRTAYEWATKLVASATGFFRMP
ncbi:hypothetical protein [Pelomonas sp. Root1237]|uniref:hypothetical protein n=1 Tax=Pelomonas sp. Root1237 TaxID=1736434 RepID=UPI0012FB99DD|nr:hypothetical protein [Pelomonas sp. Root1237]